MTRTKGFRKFPLSPNLKITQTDTIKLRQFVPTVDTTDFRLSKCSTSQAFEIVVVGNGLNPSPSFLNNTFPEHTQALDIVFFHSLRAKVWKKIRRFGRGKGRRKRSGLRDEARSLVRTLVEIRCPDERGKVRELQYIALRCEI